MFSYGETNEWSTEQNSMQTCPQQAGTNYPLNPYFPALKHLETLEHSDIALRYLPVFDLLTENPTNTVYIDKTISNSSSSRVQKSAQPNTDNVFTASGKTLWEGTQNTFGNYWYLGIMAVSLAVDEPFNRWSQKNLTLGKTKFLDRVRKVTSTPIITGSLLYGIIFSDKKATDMSLTAAKAMFVGNMVDSFLKTAVGRAGPPYTTEDRFTPEAFEFTPFDFDGHRVFPSGHVMHISPMYGVFSTYLNSPIVDAIGYTHIALMSAQRINSNVHWISDCAFSAFFGYELGKACARYQINNPNATIIPFISSNNSGDRFIGLQVSLDF